MLGAVCGCTGRSACATSARGEELGADGVVFWPRRLDGAGEGQDVFRVEGIVRRGGRLKPFSAIFDRLVGVFADVGGGLRVRRIAADVLQTPVERVNATVIVGGPAAV